MISSRTSCNTSHVMCVKETGGHSSGPRAGRRLRGGRARLVSVSSRGSTSVNFTVIFTPDTFTVRDSRKYSTRHASIGDLVFRPFFFPFQRSDGGRLSFSRSLAWSRRSDKATSFVGQVVLRNPSLASIADHSRTHPPSPHATFTAVVAVFAACISRGAAV